MTSIRRLKMADDLSRRALLKSTGVFALLGSKMTTVFGQSRAAAASGQIMSTISAYMAQAATRPLPDAVTEKTKHVILDTLAAMISGAELPPGRFAIQFARGYKGEKIATIAASNLLCGPIEAALINSMLAHSDETHDPHSFSISPPGWPGVPA